MDEFVAAQFNILPGNAVSWYERVVPELSEQQRQSLDAALASPDISARAIAVVLEGWGHPVKEGTIARWRVQRKVRA